MINNRPNIDLICVIDHSGSMMGKKMNNLKETLKLLLDFLGDNDRLAIIKFNDNAKRLIPLTKCRKENRVKFLTVINTIMADGGTDISKGMRLALKILEDRR